MKHYTLNDVITHRDMPYLDKIAAILDLAAILDFRKWAKSSY